MFFLRKVEIAEGGSHSSISWLTNFDRFSHLLGLDVTLCTAEVDSHTYFVVVRFTSLWPVPIEN